MTTFVFEPIGVVRSPFDERVAAPRQAVAARETKGRLELFQGHGYEHALEDLDAWDYIWVVFVFHKNVEQGRGWKPKVLPPRSLEKRGVFATRSPHRPNPIGMSAVRLERVDGCVVHVRGLDLLDGTPILDIKPYVPYADALADAGNGWLEARDPLPGWEVSFGEEARTQLAWLRDAGVDLEAAIAATLALGPAPHPYRRIRAHGDRSRLALKDWRADFIVEDRRVVVQEIASGYRRKDLAGDDPALDVHRRFVSRWSR